MVREIALILLALALVAGCGIKGPLRLPPTPAAAAPAATDAASAAPTSEAQTTADPAAKPKQ
jgi:predicted small lipoprotein YifL